MPWDKSKKTEGEVLKEDAISNGIPSEKILLTKGVENTSDEAVDVKKLISPSKRIILVTSAYHMYRAKRLFEKQEFIVIPYKVSRNNTKTLIDILPNAGKKDLTETGIREIIGRLYYLVKG